jgi:hypothetical protein
MDFDEWNTKILSNKSFKYMCENEIYYVECKHNLILVKKLGSLKNGHIIDRIWIFH